MPWKRRFAWPARYLLSFPQLLITVGAVALGRSRWQDIDFIAEKKLHLLPTLVRRWNREGLDLIAAGLYADGVRIF